MLSVPVGASRDENADNPLRLPADWPPSGWRIFGHRGSDRCAKGAVAPRPAMKAAHPEFRDIGTSKLEQARQLLVESSSATSLSGVAPVISFSTRSAPASRTRSLWLTRSSSRAISAT
jgi:hypothetical protein